ncbi:MAG: hypothetical protein O2887_18000 [Bacteroidetes bacterium]|nr:hypothetical protein [Bacteroidota bacterium]MDA1122349.1 hypothetical protein [Bacteroidota bacterium]
MKVNKDIIKGRNMIYYNVPAAIPIHEDFRILTYLKSTFKVGFFPKSKLQSISKVINKDKRTIKKAVDRLAKKNLIGVDEMMIYLRSWRYILNDIEARTFQAFQVKESELISKRIFESTLLSAKIKVLQKANRLASRERTKTRSYQIECPTGSLSALCKVSWGKVSKLKQHSKNQRLIKIEPQFKILYKGISPTILKYIEEPGAFYCDGNIFQRKPDLLSSNISTFKKRFWRKY